MYRTLHCILTFTITSLLLLSALPAQEKSQRVGMIGLDTSHSIAFARLLNADDPAPELAGYRVVVACPRGSADIESSTSRIPKYTEQIKELGVTVVVTIPTSTEIEGDTFFPEWEMVKHERHEANGRHEFTFTNDTWKKK